MTTAPLVSVITPTYDRAALLRTTIDSILAQQGVDLEYLVIDDGSSDGTEALVRGAADPRLRYYRHDNIGESASVNRGWSLARGRYVAVISSDDPVLPGWLHASVATLEAHPAANVSYPDWQIIDAAGAESRTIATYEFSIERAVACFHGIPGPGALVRRQVFDRHEAPRNPAYRYAPDLDQWLRLALRGPFIRIPRVLATWRDHPASITVGERTHAYADELLQVARVFHERNDLPDTVRALKRHTLSRAAYLAGVVLEECAPWRAHRLMRRSYRLGPIDHPALPPDQRRKPRPTMRDTLEAVGAKWWHRSTPLMRTPA